MKKIIGKSINSHVKQFWCKKCKVSTNVIYKDDKGNTFCNNCIKQHLNDKGINKNKNKKDNKDFE